MEHTIALQLGVDTAVRSRAVCTASVKHVKLTAERAIVSNAEHAYSGDFGLPVNAPAACTNRKISFGAKVSRRWRGMATKGRQRTPT